MRVYVAGKFSAPAEVHVAQAACRAAGHVVTYDWTTNYIAADVDLATRQHLRRVYAVADLNGVHAAEIVLALFTDPTYAYRGTFTELGFALAEGKRVFTVCPDYFTDKEPLYATNCFFEAPGVQQFPSVSAALVAMTPPTSQ